MALIVVPPDVLEVHGRCDPRPLVYVTDITRQIEIVGNRSDVALKMAEIDGVKPDQRCEETDVRLGQMIAEKEAAPRQTLFDPIQRLEERNNGIVVRSLCSREPG